MLTLGPPAAGPAYADCAVTEGSGSAANPGNGATVTCTVAGGPENATVGDGTTDATVILEDDAQIDATGDYSYGVQLQGATVQLGQGARIDADADGVYANDEALVTLGNGAAIAGGYDGVSGATATVVLGDGATIDAVEHGVFAFDGNAIVTLGTGARIDAGLRGVYADNGDATVTVGQAATIASGEIGIYVDGDARVTLEGGAAIDAAGIGILGGGVSGDATVDLGPNARIRSGGDGVIAYSGTATVTLGAGAVIDAGEHGISARSGDAVATLGSGASIAAGYDGAFAFFGNASVELGETASIEATKRGVYADNGNAVVTLGQGASIVSGEQGVGATGNAEVALETGASIASDFEGVLARNGNAEVSLGEGAGIAAIFDGVFAGGDALVTLGPDATITAGYAGVFSADGTATVTLDGAAAVSGNQRGVFAQAGDAVVTLAGGSSVSGTFYGIHGGSGENGDAVDSAGTIEGQTYSLFLREGDDRVTLRTGSNLIGPADGGPGTDSVTLSGSGSEDERFVNFEILAMDGDAWTLSGESTFAETRVQSGTLNVSGSLSGGEVAVAPEAAFVTGSTGSLQATGFAADGSVVNDGTITAESLVFGPDSLISGNGRFVGPTTLLGRVAPGSSIGTLSFVGDTILGDGSLLEVEVSPIDGADRIVVEDGALTIEPGAELVAVLMEGDFDPGARFVFLEADEGISGSFVGFEPPLLSFTDTLEIDSGDPNALSFTVVTAPGDRLIEEAPFNPVNGGPASLLPRFAADDFWIGVDPPGAGRDRAEPRLTELGLEYQHLDVDGTNVDTWTVPLRRTFDLERPGWAIVVNAPITFADVEGETALSGSVAVGLRFPATERWTLTPTVRIGAVHSDDFRTMAAGFGGSLTSSFRFSLGDYAFDLGNLVGYYGAGDVGGVIDDQVEYDTQNLTFRNGLVMSTPVEAFGWDLDTQVWAVDTRHTGEDLFVQGYTEVGASIRPRRNLFGLPPFRVGVTGTIGDNVSGIRLNAGYRF